MLEILKKSNLLTAEENVFAAMLADAVLEYARRNLKKMKRAKRKHEPIPLPLPEEPTPTGCVWIGDRCILPTTNQPITEGQQA